MHTATISFAVSALLPHPNWRMVKLSNLPRFIVLKNLQNLDNR